MLTSETEIREIVEPIYAAAILLVVELGAEGLVEERIESKAFGEKVMVGLITCR